MPLLVLFSKNFFEPKFLFLCERSICKSGWQPGAWDLGVPSLDNLHKISMKSYLHRLAFLRPGLPAFVQTTDQINRKLAARRLSRLYPGPKGIQTI
jgi:hypothetical protein